MQPYPGRACCCRHGEGDHRHYRTGSDCSRCTCPAYRRHRWWHWHAYTPQAR